jgi:hypothetical protein
MSSQVGICGRSFFGPNNIQMDRYNGLLAANSFRFPPSPRKNQDI